MIPVKAEDTVIDNRRKHFFMVDNIAYDEYAPKVGAIAFAVYTALIRHATGNTCNPSIAKIAEQLDLSDNTVKNAIKKIQKAGLIAVKQNYTFTEEGKRRNFSNTYTLLPIQGGSNADPGGTSSVDLGVGQEMTQVGQMLTQGGSTDAYKENPEKKTQKENLEAATPASKNSKADVSDAYRLAMLLQQRILQRFPTHVGAKSATVCSQWAKEISNFMQENTLAPEDIERAIDFSHRETFWQSRIVNAKSLITAFDTLTAQSSKPQKVAAASNEPRRQRKIVPAGK